MHGMKMIKDKNETDAGTCRTIEKEPLTVSCPQCKQVIPTKRGKGPLVYCQDCSEKRTTDERSPPLPNSTHTPGAFEVFGNYPLRPGQYGRYVSHIRYLPDIFKWSETNRFADVEHVPHLP